jgi:hypothetical protein
MSNVRRAVAPHPRSLLAAARPWQIEDLELDAKHLAVGSAGYKSHADIRFREILTSPLLPKLAHLSIAGSAEPGWLDGVKRCPPHLTIRNRLDSDARDLWLAAATPTGLEKLTIRYWKIDYHFTRDAKRAFTRLDIEIRLPEPVKALDPEPRGVAEVRLAVGKLPPGSLTHFDARIEMAGDNVPIPRVLKVGATKVR